MKVTRGKILVVDDDREMRTLLQDFLTGEGYTVLPFPLAMEALQALRPGGSLSSEVAQDIDVIITDLRMAHMDGMQFLKNMKLDRPEIPVILITAFGSIDTAIEAMKNGAYHYLVKPFKLAEMSVTLERAIEKRNLARENVALKEEVKRGWALGNIIGKSPGMKAVFDLIERVSHSNANILIHGESGTGKEMVAHAIHDSGPRKSKPFIAINCTAIPETLLESELFGHAKGSFTGAVGRKKGLIEEADGGTLFLDEIGDMSPPLQAKLLRVLQERKIRPVGDTNFISVDVRVIAATHKDLKSGIREGTFREDLFYRLSVIPLTLPPLRDRAEDIPLLAESFLKKYAATSEIQNNLHRVRGFSKEAVAKLLSLRWPGNVRELENVIERAVVLARETSIEASDIPDPDEADPDTAFRNSTSDFPTLEQLEQRYMRLILQKTAGRKDKTAQILGISRRTLYRKERDYGWVSEESEKEENRDAEAADGDLD